MDPAVAAPDTLPPQHPQPWRSIPRARSPRASASPAFYGNEPEPRIVMSLSLPRASDLLGFGRKIPLVRRHVDPDGLSFRKTGTLSTHRLQHGGVLGCLE